MPSGVALARPAVPASEVPGDPAVQIVAAADTTCAVLRSGAVSCWGAGFGTPRRINGWTDVVRIALTPALLCVLHRDDRVACGELPDRGSERARFAVRALAGTRHAIDVVASDDAMCVLERGGGIACWVAGAPPRVTHARVTRARSLVMGPVVGPELAGPAHAAVESYACALVAGDRVACFDVSRGAAPGAVRTSDAIAGATRLQEAQGPTSQIFVTSPGRAPRCLEAAGDAVEACASRCAGRGDAVAEAGACAPRCTRHGDAVSCQLRERAVTTVALAAERPLAVGAGHACALTEAGGVVCWGDDRIGQLGRGRVEDDRVLPVLGLHDAVDVVTWTYGAIALRANGQLAYWGNGDAGDPAPVDRPVTFSSITDAARVVAGHDQVCVRRRTGAVACWGGALGGRHAPAEVAALHGATELRATDFGVLARAADGSWLHLGDPQLGAAAAPGPAPIAGAAHAAEIVVAGQWICVLDRAPGPVRCHAETHRWSTPEITIGLGVVELAGSGPRDTMAMPGVLTAAGEPPLHYPRSRLVARLADGRALEVALDIEQGAPRATVAPLIASGATAVFASGDQACARAAGAIACVTADAYGTTPQVIPRALLGAGRLTLGDPLCGVLPGGEVVCSGDPFARGAGRGWSDVPLPVTW